MTVLTTIRQTTPLVLNLANAVTIGDVANGLIALGAAPIRSSDSNESTEMVAIANAVAINLGTLNPTQIDQMHAVWEAANAADKPVVFDPVGIGALKYRLAVANELLTQHKVALIRGMPLKLRLWRANLVWRKAWMPRARQSILSPKPKRLRNNTARWWWQRGLLM